MQMHAGVFRTQALMDEGVGKIKAIAERVKSIHLADKSKVFNTARIEALEVDNLMEWRWRRWSRRRRGTKAAAPTPSTTSADRRPEHPNGRNDAEWMKHTLWYSRRQPPRLQAGAT